MKILLLLCIAIVPAMSYNCSVELIDRDNVIASLEEYLNVTCSSDGMLVEISSCVFEQMGYDPSTDVVLKGPNAMSPDCTGEYSYEYHKIMWNIDLDDCGMDVTTVDAMRWYTNTIATTSFSNVPDLSVVFGTDIYVNVTCKYEYDLYSDNLGPYNATIVPITDVMAMAEGEYDETVMLCEDEDCDNVIAPHSIVAVLDPVYIVVEVNYGALVVQFDTIWATPSAYKMDDTNYYMMTAGCPTSEQFAVVHYQGTEAWFCFPAFYWYGDKYAQIFIHVEFTLCDVDVQGSDCTTEPVCDRRRKRAIDGVAPKVETKTIGPISVKS